jgi:hypothetical protein
VLGITAMQDFFNIEQAQASACPKFPESTVMIRFSVTREATL